MASRSLSGGGLVLKWILAAVLLVASFTDPALAHPERAARMAEASTAFLDTLSAEERALATRAFDDDSARTHWSFLPAPMAPRIGIELGALSATQRIAAHRVLAAALSAQGYHTATSIMWLDDILRAEEEVLTSQMSASDRARREPLLRSRDSGQYWLLFFGDPGAARWGWMLSGHHLAVNFTVVDDRIAFTPMFVGANPQTVQQGRYAGWSVLEHELDRAFALVGSLDERQRAQAVQAETIQEDFFTGPGRDIPAPVGVAASRLSQEQRALLWGLVRDFVGDTADETAEAQLADIRSDGVGQIRFAWWGSTDDPSQRFFFRLQGPSILIEYVRESNAQGGPANHVHAIVRDPRNDYGSDWLDRHYREAH